MPWDSVASFEVKNGEFLRNSDLGNGNFNDLPLSWYLRYLDQISPINPRTMFYRMYWYPSIYRVVREPNGRFFEGTSEIHVSHPYSGCWNRSHYR